MSGLFLYAGIKEIGALKTTGDSSKATTGQVLDTEDRRGYRGRYLRMK